MKKGFLFTLLFLSSSNLWSIGLSFKSGFQLDINDKMNNQRRDCSIVRFDHQEISKLQDKESLNVGNIIFEHNYSKYLLAAKVLKNKDREIEDQKLTQGAASLIEFHRNGYLHSKVANEIESVIKKDEYRINQFVCKLSTLMNDCLNENTIKEYRTYSCSKKLSKTMTGLIHEELERTPKEGLSGLYYGGTKFSNTSKENPGPEWYELKSIGTFNIDYKNESYSFYSQHGELFKSLGINWINCESKKKCKIILD